MGGRPLRALAAGRHRRGHRAPHDRHRLPARPQGGARAAGSAGPAEGGQSGRFPPAPLPQMQPAGADPVRGLRYLHVVRLFQVRVMWIHHRGTEDTKKFRVGTLPPGRSAEGIGPTKRSSFPRRRESMRPHMRLPTLVFTCFNHGSPPSRG
ncbi:hypothetical protein MTBUT4_220061 [Magnetospirillum sp. UT-4]|nr:hypothetical protein MTBUT4_220061 [Magnetospirillum sp. UT-4]